MVKVVACIIARTVSTRLPLKVLRDVGNGMSILDFLINRLKSVKEIDEIFICTSTEPVDDILEDVASRNSINIYRGSADQVIERMLKVGAITNADYLIRITGDNPFTSIEHISTQVEMIEKEELDYVRLVNVPVGATTEVIKYQALLRCNEMMDPDVSEYMMLYLFEPHNFKCGVIIPYVADYSHYSVTVDTQQDFVRTRRVVEVLKEKAPEEIMLEDILALYTNAEISIPFAEIKAVDEVKLPYNKKVSYTEFKKDMDRRISQSVQL
ncbi:cytidylyltransferase domain-containing protein [Pontibacter amylolyticus]|uniref:3-deoxy-manno-octulosonate cytidylyltransferase n=1 Tax=Pontibacter amylolyticus TaxID=1424080 RepID=A0ABQ1WCN8_9BACT|nr:hypothetical protein [Pontibacter amylolyticus]GGG25263.1 hypothetical protein GCM10011323_31280 [Pontibacter amylolyticus]